MLGAVVAVPSGSGIAAIEPMQTGITLNTSDIDATHARLVAAGIDVSEVRIGRKPGTRVLSVRDGTCGVHTLLLERTAQRAAVVRHQLANLVLQGGDGGDAVGLAGERRHLDEEGARERRAAVVEGVGQPFARGGLVVRLDGLGDEELRG